MLLYQQNGQTNTGDKKEPEFSKPISINNHKKPVNEYNVFSAENIDIDTMSKELGPFVSQVKRLTDVNEGTAPLILENCADGLSRVALYRAKAATKANMARTERKNIEAKVSLEEFPKWVKQNPDNKNTDKTRELFVNQHELVIHAKKMESEAVGLLSFLDSLHQLFVMSLSSAKAIAYSSRNSDFVSGRYTTEE